MKKDDINRGVKILSCERLKRLSQNLSQENKIKFIQFLDSLAKGLNNQKP